MIALDSISLAVDSGEIVCLVGQSGCGKSTLLRLIAGVDRPDAGRIILNGEEIAGPRSYREPEERRIGLMFQDYALFPHLSVVDNILFGLKKMPRGQALLRCEAIVAKLGISHLKSRFPHMLSGGEQQRVALARALAPQPSVLLMDEPFSNLDRKLRDGVRDETLGLLRELGTTVIIVTHDPEEALSIGDRVVLMRSGQIAQSGSGSEVYDRPTTAYAAEFFCKFNKVHGACSNSHAETPLGRFHAPGYADGDHAVVYIRPQCVRVVNEGVGIPARVVSCALMGEIEQILLAIESLPEPLRIRSTERRGLRTGDEIRVAVKPEETFVF
ncbi:MAG: ABC transporter ATP-binding protein [Rhizobiaceae bacterium]